MALFQWSTTPANNASAGAIDWAEGQPPSTVNDSARQMMADVAVWYAAPEWLNYGLTPTFLSATQFTVAGNQTSIYTVGRRVRAFVTAGIVFGVIGSSSFSSLTTVAVTWDSGSLDSGVSEVDVGIMNPAHPSLSTLSALNLSGLLSTANNIAMTAPTASIEMGSTAATNTPFIDMHSSGNANDYDVRIIATGGSAAIGLGILNINAAGGLVCSGNITASSDERLKEDWGNLATDFIERLAAVRSGTYTRIDTEQRHVGVGAQSLQALLPEAVVESEKGILSVAYGQAALAACVELAKEVVRLRALVEAK